MFAQMDEHITDTPVQDNFWLSDHFFPYSPLLDVDDLLWAYEAAGQPVTKRQCM